MDPRDAEHAEEPFEGCWRRALARFGHTYSYSGGVAAVDVRYECKGDPVLSGQGEIFSGISCQYSDGWSYIWFCIIPVRLSTTVSALWSIVQMARTPGQAYHVSPRPELCKLTSSQAPWSSSFTSEYLYLYYSHSSPIAVRSWTALDL
jgi:hypothetical protein